MSVMKTPHRDELLAAVDTPVYLGQPGLPLDIMGVVPPIPEGRTISLPDGTKVTFKVYRDITIWLRGQPAYVVRLEETAELHDQLTNIRWALATTDEARVCRLSGESVDGLVTACFVATEITGVADVRYR